MHPIRLGINIDHVATLRNARGGLHPCPIRAAQVAKAAGADSIVAHLREDRRHIRDADVRRLVEEIGLPLTLEMAATDEMLAMALEVRPHAVCLVPEKRAELTTEGGLNVVQLQRTLTPLVSRLQENGSQVSLFIDPDERQLQAAQATGAQAIELHTGGYAEDVGELRALQQAAAQAAALGLEVHAGHGLNFDNVGAIAAVPQIVELNIGHFLIGEAVFTGLAAAITDMRRRMEEARG